MEFKNKVVVASLVLGVVFLSGCGGSSSSASTDNTVPPVATQSVANPITIDNSGVIPIINGQTSTVVYVHNNSDKTISGIKYSIQANVNGNLSTNSGKLNHGLLRLLQNNKTNSTASNILDSASAGLCSTIPAGQSCPLSISAPLIGEKEHSAAALLKASYQDGQNPRSFSNVLNFSWVDISQNNGVIFSSDVGLNTFGNPSGYATLYMIGTGKGDLHTVKLLSTSLTGVKIVQGNVIGKKIQSGFVQAVEVSSLVNYNLKNKLTTLSRSTVAGNEDTTGLATVRSTSNLLGTLFTATAGIGYSAQSKAGILHMGNIPVFDSSETQSGSVYITNAGNDNVTLGDITTASGKITLSAGGDCAANSTVLTPGAACTINFTVHAQSSDSDTVTVAYSDNSGIPKSVLGNVTWYYGKASPMMGISTLPAGGEVSFLTSASGMVNYTVTNSGGYDFESFGLALSATSGGAVVDNGSPNCRDKNNNPTGINLPVGGQCSGSLTITNPNVSDGIVKFALTGKYSDKSGGPMAYQRQYVINYHATASVSSLGFDSIWNTVSVVGDNHESSVQDVTLTNAGPGSATIGNVAIESADANLSIVNNACSSILPAGNSCIIKVKVGPTLTATQITGSDYLVVSYSDQTTGAGTVRLQIDYTITPNQQNLELTSQDALGEISGNGNTLIESYVFSGATNGTKQIVLTYTNKGNNPIKITGVNNNNSPLAWSINTVASTCYSGGSLPSPVLPVGNSCSIVFDNDFHQNIQAIGTNVGSEYQENLTVPEIVFQDVSNVGSEILFVTTPSLSSGQNVIFATATQATIANTLEWNGSESKVVVKHSLANTAGYSAIISVNTNMEDYFESNVVADSGCSILSRNDATISQVCALDPTQGDKEYSVTYDLNPNYMDADLHAFFELSNGSAVVAMDPRSLFRTLQ